MHMHVSQPYILLAQMKARHIASESRTDECKADTAYPEHCSQISVCKLYKVYRWLVSVLYL